MIWVRGLQSHDYWQFDASTHAFRKQYFVATSPDANDKQSATHHPYYLQLIFAEPSSSSLL
jgi:hypothetical protein